jgi:hypothetical protein
LRASTASIWQTRVPRRPLPSLLSSTIGEEWTGRRCTPVILQSSPAKICWQL